MKPSKKYFDHSALGLMYLNCFCIQILVQIQQTALQSQRALSVSRQQAAAKDRERRILQLTIDEISHVENDVNLYKGVGKMFVDVQ